jgi:hypothetical protein
MLGLFVVQKFACTPHVAHSFSTLVQKIMAADPGGASSVRSMEEILANRSRDGGTLGKVGHSVLVLLNGFIDVPYLMHQHTTIPHIE